MKAVFALIALLAMPADASVLEPSPDETYNLTGAGATFPFPLIDLWRVEYNKLYGNVNLNYQSIGSGGGIKQHIEKTVNFAASDKPMSEAERQLAPGTMHIPESIGGVVLVYNLPEVQQKGLKLTPDAIAGIFLGEITRWNDPLIAVQNPGLELPDKEIISAHRSDGSGTTFIFTDYLSVVSPKWDQQVGKSKSVPWPSGLAAAGNEGVAGIVKSTEYSIGYVELAYAFQTGMSFASVQNADKTAFIEPTLETISAASEGVAGSLPGAQDSWVDVSLVNAPGSDSYPIASFTYLLVYDDLGQVTGNIGQARAIVHLIHWMITDGQEFSPGLLYVPLSDNVVDIGRQALSQISYNGASLQDGSVPQGAPDTPAEPVPGGGGCLIATATFGSEMAPQVQRLRELRENTVLGTGSGAAFIESFNHIYYSFSPAVSDLQRQSPIFNGMVKAAITPMLASLSILEHAPIDSEWQMITYGMSVMLLNIGMYLGVPVAIYKAGRRVTLRL